MHDDDFMDRVMEDRRQKIRENNFSFRCFAAREEVLLQI
jgi:hypothetical protein